VTARNMTMTARNMTSRCPVSASPGSGAHAGSLGRATETDDDSPPGTAMCLAATTDNLAAGRDLLHTHFTTDQSGWRHGTSPWAPAIAGRQVNGALAGSGSVFGCR
jgi:hypothetical protein